MEELRKKVGEYCSNDGAGFYFFVVEEMVNRFLEFGSNGINPFSILKDEVYDGVGNTAKRRFTDGYERMLAVMEQVVNVRIVKFYQSYSKYWLDDKVKKGVCHFLVIDDRLRWVRT